jgi:ribose/xylose/arabinose/galactoside ABC-type transport system permease subunit
MDKQLLKPKVLSSKWFKSLVETRKSKARLLMVIMFIAMGGVFCYFALTAPGFLTAGNAVNMAQRLPADIIVAVAQTMVIITAGIDLSVGAVLAFSGSLTAVAFCYWGLSVWVAILLGLVSGAIIGCITGIIITKGRIPDFIATLGMMVTVRGVALILTGGLPVPSHMTAVKLRAYMPEQIVWLGSGSIFKIPAPLIISLVIVIIGWIILNHTSFGRSLFATGGNQVAASISGINVNLTKIKVYALSGLLSAIAGIILIGRMNSANALMADDANMQSIAAVVIGGTGLFGGQGGVIGSLFGASILGILRNILNLHNVHDFAQRVFLGLLIIGVVVIDQLRRKYGR